MTALPSASAMTGASVTVSQRKTDVEDQRKFIAEFPFAGARQALTISSGSITPAADSTRTLLVDTEAAASTDDLANVVATNANTGNVIYIYAADATHDVVVKDAAGGAGQLHLRHNADFTLDELDKWISFRYDGTDWQEVNRSYGNDLSGRRSDLGLGTWAEKSATHTPKSGAYTLVAADNGIFIDGSTASAWNLTFLSAATAGANYFVAVRNSGTSGNDITLVRDGTDTFNGATTYTVSDGESVFIWCDGTSDWNVVKVPTDKKTATIQLTAIGFSTNCSTGDGKTYFRVPEYMDGMNLTGVHAESITAGTGTGSDTMDIQIHNIDNALDMLSTKLTIDEDETGSDTAATAAVINTSNDHVNTNDILRVDIDAVTPTTPHVGLIVSLDFEQP